MMLRSHAHPFIGNTPLAYKWDPAYYVPGLWTALAMLLPIVWREGCYFPLRLPCTQSLSLLRTWTWRRQANQTASKTSLEGVTQCPPLPKGLPQGAKVLVHRATTGTASTEDVPAKPRHVRTPLQGRREVIGGNTWTTRRGKSRTRCPRQGRVAVCHISVRPTVRCLLWDCPGLVIVREKYKGRGTITGGMDLATHSGRCPANDRYKFM